MKWMFSCLILRKMVIRRLCVTSAVGNYIIISYVVEWTNMILGLNIKTFNFDVSRILIWTFFFYLLQTEHQKNIYYLYLSGINVTIRSTLYSEFEKYLFYLIILAYIADY